MPEMHHGTCNQIWWVSSRSSEKDAREIFIFMSKIDWILGDGKPAWQSRGGRYTTECNNWCSCLSYPILNVPALSSPFVNVNPPSMLAR